MKRALAMLVMGGLLIGSVVPAMAQDALDPTAAMMMMAKPGEKHELLQKMVGKYDIQAKWYEPTDSGEMKVTEEPGTATFESVLGGRFVVQTFKSKHMGQPFEGIGAYGYDNAQKKFVGIWMDNFNTGIMHTEGKLDKKTGYIHETGKVVTPVGEMVFKMVTKPTADGFVFELASETGDKQTPIGTLTYTRK